MDPLYYSLCDNDISNNIHLLHVIIFSVFTLTPSG